MGRDSRFLRPTQVMTRGSHGEGDGVDGVGSLTGARGASITIVPRAFLKPRLGTGHTVPLATAFLGTLRRESCKQYMHAW